MCRYTRARLDEKQTRVHRSRVHWATALLAAARFAAQPSPVLTCRIPVSPPEETLASFTSAWDQDPAVFGFVDGGSVTRRFRYERVARPYHMTRKLNISLGIV